MDDKVAHPNWLIRNRISPTGMLRWVDAILIDLIRFKLFNFRMTQISADSFLPIESTDSLAHDAALDTGGVTIPAQHSDEAQFPHFENWEFLFPLNCMNPLENDWQFSFIRSTELILVHSAHHMTSEITGSSTNRIDVPQFVGIQLQPPVEWVSIFTSIVKSIKSWTYLNKYTILQSQCHGFLSNLIDFNSVFRSTQPLGKYWILFESSRLKTEAKFDWINSEWSLGAMNDLQFLQSGQRLECVDSKLFDGIIVQKQIGQIAQSPERILFQWHQIIGKNDQFPQLLLMSEYVVGQSFHRILCQIQINQRCQTVECFGAQIHDVIQWQIQWTQPNQIVQHQIVDGRQFIAPQIQCFQQCCFGKCQIIDEFQFVFGQIENFHVFRVPKHIDTHEI